MNLYNTNNTNFNLNKKKKLMINLIKNMTTKKIIKKKNEEK